MLFSYFSKKLLKQFFLFFTCLNLIFGTVNLFMRLPITGSIGTIPIVFWTMLPVIMLTTFPLSVGMTTHHILGTLLITNEWLILKFLKNAHRALTKVIFCFACLGLLIYIPLIFEWGPKSYREGKKLLLNVAKKELFELPAHILHTPIPGFSFIFHKKIIKKNETSYFKTLFINFKNKKEQYFFSAKAGSLQNNLFVLKKGSVYFFSHDTHYSATFNEATIDLENLLNYQKNVFNAQHQKFSTWNTLFKLQYSNIHAFIELHKRFAQIIWQFFLPFFAILTVIIFQQRKNSMINAILFSGIIFFLMYFFLALGQTLKKSILSTLLFFYLPPILLFFFFYYFYLKKI